MKIKVSLLSVFLVVTNSVHGIKLGGITARPWPLPTHIGFGFLTLGVTSSLSKNRITELANRADLTNDQKIKEIHSTINQGTAFGALLGGMLCGFALDDQKVSTPWIISGVVAGTFLGGMAIRKYLRRSPVDSLPRPIQRNNNLLALQLSL